MQPLVEEDDSVVHDGVGHDFTDGTPNITTESSMFTLQSPTTILDSDRTDIQIASVDDTTNNSYLPFSQHHPAQDQYPVILPSRQTVDVVSSTPIHVPDSAWQLNEDPRESDGDFPLTPHVEVVSSTPVHNTVSGIGGSTAPELNSYLTSSETLIGDSIIPLSPYIDDPLPVVPSIPQTVAPELNSALTSSETFIGDSIIPLSPHTDDPLPVVVSSTPQTVAIDETSPAITSAINSTSVLVSTATSLPACSSTPSTSTAVVASSTEPVVSIKTTGSNFNFSGSGGSVPTNSWNIVPVPSVTDSLPRNALQEDEIEVVDFDVSFLLS